MFSLVGLCPLIEAAHVFIYSYTAPVFRQDSRQQDSLSTHSRFLQQCLNQVGPYLGHWQDSFSRRSGSEMTLHCWQRQSCHGPLVGSAGNVDLTLLAHPLLWTIDNSFFSLSLTSSSLQHLFSDDQMPSPGFLQKSWNLT